MVVEDQRDAVSSHHRVKMGDLPTGWELKIMDGTQIFHVCMCVGG